MKWLKLLFVLLGLALGGLFLVQNESLLQQQLAVSLRLPLLHITSSDPAGVRLDVMLVIAFAGGFLIALTLGIWRRARSALLVRRLRRQVDRLEGELELAVPPAEHLPGAAAARVPGADSSASGMDRP